MKEKNSIDESKLAQMAEGIELIPIRSKNKKVHQATIESLPVYLVQANTLNTYQSKLIVNYEHLMELLNNYETTTNKRERDPLIQWAINNKRDNIKKSYLQLNPNLTELIRTLSTPQSMVSGSVLNQKVTQLTKEYDELNHELIQQTQLIEYRIKELQLITDLTSPLTQLIHTVREQESIFFTTYNEVKPVEIDSNKRSSEDDEVIISLIKTIHALVNRHDSVQLPIKPDLTVSLDSLNNLEVDDRDCSIFYANQCIKQLQTTHLQLKINASAIMLDSKRLTERHKIIVDCHAELEQLYDKMVTTIQNQPLKTLNEILKKELATYNEYVQLILKQQNTLVHSPYKTIYKQSSEFAKIMRALHKNIEELRSDFPSNIEPEISPLDTIRTLGYSINESLKIQLNMAPTIHVNLGSYECTETIRDIQNSRIQSDGLLKIQAYQRIITALKEACQRCIPFYSEKEKYSSLTKQLEQLKAEVKNKLYIITHSPYSKHVYYQKNEINAFIDEKRTLMYREFFLMHEELQENIIEKEQIIHALDQSIVIVNTRFVNQLQSLPIDIQNELNKLDDTVENYRPWLIARLDLLNKLNKPNPQNMNQFFKTEINALAHHKKMTYDKFFLIEATKNELVSIDTEKRSHSNVVQCIEKFREATILEDYPEEIIDMLNELELATEDYIARRTDKKQFHAAIADAINKMLLTPDILNDVAYYDANPYRNCIQICLEFLNQMLVFISQTIRINEEHRPQFFSTISNEIQKCDLARTLENARYTLLELTKINDNEQSMRCN